MKISSTILTLLFAATLSFSAVACEPSDNASVDYSATSADTESLGDDVLARLRDEINEE